MEMNKKSVNKPRNGKLDFMKFVFSLILVIHHGRNLMGDEGSLFLGGSFIVEFFFIVSGCLMMASIKKMGETGLSLGEETRRFIVKKYKALCPEIFVGYFIALLFFCVVKRADPLDAFVKTVFEGVGLRMFGLHIWTINGAVWYISSMLLCMVILFPLIRKYPEMSVKVIIPFAALAIMGYYCGNETSLRNPTLWVGWTYKGNFRALAEIGIGVCTYELVERLKRTDFTKLGKIVLSLVEDLLYLFMIWYMYAHMASRRDYLFTLLFAVTIAITLSHKGITASWFDNKICTFLGKYSFALFLSHTYYAEYLGKLLPKDWGYSELMAVYVPCSLITGFIIMGISAWIRKNWSKWSRAIRSHVIAEK